MDYEYDLPSSTNLLFLGGILVYSRNIHLSQISHSKTSLQKFRVEVHRNDPIEQDTQHGSNLYTRNSFFTKLVS